MFTSIKIKQEYLYQALVAFNDKLLPSFYDTYNGKITLKAGRLCLNNDISNVVLTKDIWHLRSSVYIKKNIYVIDTYRRNKFLIFKFNHKQSLGIIVKGSYSHKSKNYIYFTRDRDEVFDLWSYHIITGEEKLILNHGNFMPNYHYFLKNNILTFNTEMFHKDCKRFVKEDFKLSNPSLFNYIRYKFFKNKLNNKEILKSILIKPEKVDANLENFQIKQIKVNFSDSIREIPNLSLIELNSRFINDQLENNQEIFLDIESEKYLSLEFLYYINSTKLYDKINKLMI